MERRNAFVSFVISLIMIFLSLFTIEATKNKKSILAPDSLGNEIGNWKGKLKDKTSIKLSLYKNGNAALYINNRLVDPLNNKNGISYFIDYTSKPIELVVFMRDRGDGTSEAMLFYLEFLSKDLLRVYTNFDYIRVSEVEDIKNIFLLRKN